MYRNKKGGREKEEERDEEGMQRQLSNLACTYAKRTTSRLALPVILALVASATI